MRRIEGFLDRIQRARADIAVDNAKRGKCECCAGGLVFPIFFQL
jgi:hypothetical protein